MVVMAFSWLAGCGGSGRGDDLVPDADPSIPPTDGLVDSSTSCYPLHNVGCGFLEKCTFVVESESPLTGHTQCVDAGDVPVGMPCVRDPITGIDDCKARAWCDGRLCREICELESHNCDGRMTCTYREGLFEGEGFGVCLPPCSVFAQDCPDGEACYLLLNEWRYPMICGPPWPEPAEPDGCEPEEQAGPQAPGECCS